MNCTTVEKLLPLYLEDDLVAREAQLVRAHLSSCEGCRSLAEEFRSSQARLHNFAVPEFGAEFYEQIRGAVLTEINSRPVARPSFFRRLHVLFPVRPALAVSLSLLVVCGALTWVVYRSLIKDDNRLAALETSRVDFNPVLFQASPDAPDKQEGSTRGSAGERKSGLTTDNRARQKFSPAARREGRAQVPASENIDAATATAAQPAGNDDERADSAPTQAIARMEIQTSDPNIRIIWLGRKAGE
jgi:hypothetical protein